MDSSKANRGSNLPIIGATEWVTVSRYPKIPAKTDTGAQSSSIWASHIRVSKDGTLKFQLFDEGSKHYTGRVFKRTPGNYKVGIIRSSNGQEEIRYRVYLPVQIAGKKVRVLFSLTDRSHNNFPILIGRRTLSGKFLVDPSLQRISKIPVDTKNPATNKLNTELAKSPWTFHQKYVTNKERR